ncbi:MAG: hypothetical protein QOF58_1007, partial [Pseudonocardiales bacterium]|nr:hypothetical protein [Pseudonocardiales bacterium]
MAKPTTVPVFRPIPHLDGCSDATASIPCFTRPGGTCYATNILGNVTDVC